jgi:hypothetical protein
VFTCVRAQVWSRVAVDTSAEAVSCAIVRDTDAEALLHFGVTQDMFPTVVCISPSGMQQRRFKGKLTRTAIIAFIAETPIDIFI